MTVPDTIRLAAAAEQAIARAARSAWPDEMVGLLGGARHGRTLLVRAFLPLRGARCTRDRFVVPAAVFAAGEHDLRTNGVVWLGFAHSHPDGSPTPSATDRAELWRDCLHVIAATDAAGNSRLAAFWATPTDFVALGAAAPQLAR